MATYFIRLTSWEEELPEFTHPGAIQSPVLIFNSKALLLSYDKDNAEIYTMRHLYSGNL